jgi:hypothetical protein
MGHQTVQIKNQPSAMEAFTPTEILYVIKNSNTIEQIANLTSGAYDGGGNATQGGLIAGQNYEWVKGANDLTLVNKDANGVVVETLTASGQFSAKSTSVTLTGTAASNITATVIKTAFWQKLWLYPIKSFAAGVPTANGASIRLGKSGAVTTQYLPDTLAATDVVIGYSLPDGQKMHINQILVRGTAADGVFAQFT